MGFLLLCILCVAVGAAFALFVIKAANEGTPPSQPAQPRCRHINRVPVPGVPTPEHPEGETVAQLCRDCDAQLDADWPNLADLTQMYGNPRLSGSALNYSNFAQLAAQYDRGGWLTPDHTVHYHLPTPPPPTLPDPGIEEYK